MENPLELSCTLVVRLPQRFTVSTFARDYSPERKTVKIEVDKSTKQKRKRKNTGIQVTISDDLFPVVTHLQALTQEELPTAYLLNYLPKVWQDRNKLMTAGNRVLLKEGELYSRQEIADALLHIRLAGEHLAAVNKSEGQYIKYRQAATFRDGRLV